MPTFEARVLYCVRAATDPTIGYVLLQSAVLFLRLRTFLAHHPRLVVDLLLVQYRAFETQLTLE